MPMLASSHDGVARATLAVPWLLDAAVRCYDTGDRGIALETGSPVSYTHLTLPTNREV